MRKPRSDSKLLNLPEEQQAQLADWLLSGVPYYRVRELVKKEFAVTTSLAALSGFYDAYCKAELISRRRRAVSTADEVAAEAERQPGRFDQATIEELKRQAFELAISPGADPKAVKAVFTLVLKARDQEIEERQLELDAEKFKHQVKTNVERGLEALAEQVRGNAAAEKLYRQFREVVLREVDNAA